jgi:methenyltetrahydromethanopterin cyclohydrolase
MGTLSQDIARDVKKYTKKSISSYMSSESFTEGVYDAVARSITKRVLAPRKYIIEDVETGENFFDGKVADGEPGVPEGGNNW